MSRIIFGVILLPVVVWLVIGFLLSAYLPPQYKQMVPGYVLGAMTLIVMWWGVLIARWTRQKIRYESIGYLIANLFVSLAIVSFPLSIVITLPKKLTILSAFTFGIFCIVGLSWLVGSIVQLIRDRKNRRYNTPFWWFLESSSFVWLPRNQKNKAQPHQAEELKKDRGTTNSVPLEPETALFKRIATKTENADDTAIRIPSRSSAETLAKHAPEAPPKPKLPEVIPSKGNRPSSFTITTSVHSISTGFLESAHRFAKRTERKADPIPFMAYWPTYHDMSPAQQKWYFYWRTELRNGHFLPADTSYLFLYVYEVINLIGFQTPPAAFDHLVKFWKFYRVLQPKLDNYLVDWIADFLIIHKLPLQPLEWYGQAVQAGVHAVNEELLFEAWIAHGSDFSTLPISLIYHIAEFSPKQNKFYQAYSRTNDLDNAYKKGIQAVNEYLLQTRNTSFFELFVNGAVTTVKRAPFASARHEYSEQEISIAKVRSWLDRDKLTSHLKSIIKHTENILREREKFGSKLRGIDLPQEWKNAIEKAFVISAPKPKIEIDYAGIEALRRDSEEIRQRLIVNEEIAKNSSGVVKGANPYYQAESHESNNGSSFTVRPTNAPDELLTDLVAIAVIMGEATGDGATVLKALRNEGWQANTKALETKIPNVFVNVVIDQINARSFTQLGDALIFSEEALWVVADDYRDEISYILDHPDYHSNTPPTTGTVIVKSVTSNLCADLPEEWTKFAQKLKAYHWSALDVLLDEDNVKKRLDLIARDAHLTVNRLIDDINEFALDSISDIVIDTTTNVPEIEDEDRENLEALVRWATDNANIKV